MHYVLLNNITPQGLQKLVNEHIARGYVPLGPPLTCNNTLVQGLVISDEDAQRHAPHVDEHRRGMNDIEWHERQPLGPAKYVFGDIVEFMVGGMGVVSEVDAADDCPAEYAIDPVPNQPYHPKGISAWHYEGDIRRLVEPSAQRKLKGKQ